MGALKAAMTALIFGLTSALFFVTIVAQALWRGFNGAQWYWWGNRIISGGLAVGVLTARQKAGATRAS